MIGSSAVSTEPGTIEPRPDRDAVARCSGAGALLLAAVWCGLASGLLEVGVTILRKQYGATNRFYWTTRHFVWLVPLIDLAILVGLAAVLGIVARLGRRWGQEWTFRAVGGLALLPPLLAGFPGIYASAGLLLTTGIAWRLTPVLSRRPAAVRRLVRVGLPLLAAAVLALGASLASLDRLEARREWTSPLPSPGSPNVLLIILDTVAADHLDLHGYPRPTSRTLTELARRSIWFREARAASSWTLLSHASMFTGRWPHELSAGWLTPLDGAHPTVAERLRSHGYATAGFVGNLQYCGWDSGLARGFTTYRDYPFLRLADLRASVLIDRLTTGALAIQYYAEKFTFFDKIGAAVRPFWQRFLYDQKRAEVVHHEFLEWLDHDRDPNRPFFGFLNLFDAHSPYELRPAGIHRFGARPRNQHEEDLLTQWLDEFLRAPSDRLVPPIRDRYDDCVADLEEQLGWLIDQLDRRGVLEQTWIIITSDHGESFGEHPGVFFHGGSLYRTELHVPLLIVPPGHRFSPRVVNEPVSLRNLAATIVDIAGPGASSPPLPGVSMARAVNNPEGEAPAPGPVLSEVIPNRRSDEAPSEWLRKTRWPSAALTEGDWTYIRSGKAAREELYRIREDPGERQNLASDPILPPVLLRLRAELDRLSNGALTPDHFPP